jgi:hypothetical protein
MANTPPIGLGSETAWINKVTLATPPSAPAYLNTAAIRGERPTRCQSFRIQGCCFNDNKKKPLSS